MVAIIAACYLNRTDVVGNHQFHQIAELQSQLELTIEEKNKTREELDSTIERVSKKASPRDWECPSRDSVTSSNIMSRLAGGGTCQL